MATDYWAITLHSIVAEELSYQLFDQVAGDLAIGGCEFPEPELVRCFIKGDESQCQSLIREAQQLGFTLRSYEPVADQNWVAKCAELWKPVTAGEITVVPVAGPSEAPHQVANTIALIPGTGFGTGHHESTRLMLSIMQDARIITSAPRSVLDLGTGSGILAIAASKLYSDLPCAGILALDNDAEALTNARDNVLLNNCQERIQVELGTLPFSSNEVHSSFDLVVANIYAEVLCKLEAEIRAVTKVGGFLVMSGIMTGLAPSVVSTFSEPRWKLLRREELNREEFSESASALNCSWTGVLCQRVS